MRRLNAFAGNTFSFYKDVVTSKRNSEDDPTYKARLAAMDGLVQPLFNSYDERFNARALESLIAHTLTPAERADLLKLYSYRNSVLQKLKIQLTTIEFNKVLNTCQCCTIGEVSSFDHLVPKQEFPEFAVNPKNLFPSCHKCNGCKTAIWRPGGVRRFLNLFLDDLPHVQYLFVNLAVDPSGTVSSTFTVQNTGGIDNHAYALIESHYTHLDLCRRFKQNADSVVVNVANAIRAGRINLGKAEIVAQIQATCEANKAFFGFNYWKCVLESALAGNADFINIMYDNP